MLTPWLRDVLAALCGLAALCTFSIGMTLTYLHAGALPTGLILVALICAITTSRLGRYDPEQIRQRTQARSNPPPSEDNG